MGRPFWQAEPFGGCRPSPRRAAASHLGLGPGGRLGRFAGPGRVRRRLLPAGRVWQRHHHRHAGLPDRILASEDWWCQGYSEPGAGSDLASLQTRAVPDGDDYIVNGGKIWTTRAQDADWIFCLVRTSSEGKRQAGISFLLIDMNSPGVEVRPIILTDLVPAPQQEVNEVFFTDVRVPRANRVGEENKGWTYAKYLLEFERGNAYAGQLASLSEQPFLNNPTGQPPSLAGVNLPPRLLLLSQPHKRSGEKLLKKKKKPLAGS